MRSFFKSDPYSRTPVFLVVLTGKVGLCYNRKKRNYGSKTAGKVVVRVSRRKILIVDDSRLNRTVLSDMFSDHYEIAEAENGQDALDILDDDDYGPRQIAAVLLDVVMPVMDGYQLLDALKDSEILQRIPFFMITAENDAASIARGYAAGVMDVVNKPYNPALIRRRIGSIIELYETRLQLRMLIEEQAEVLAKRAKKMEERLDEQLAASRAVIEALATVTEFGSDGHREHIHRIQALTGGILRHLAMHWPDKAPKKAEIDLIVQAAALHDIGMALTQDESSRFSPLRESEEQLMRQHPIRGCEFLEQMDALRETGLMDYALEICRCHHERWNGDGFPAGLKGDAIPLIAQVVGLADVYDALLTDWSHRPAYSSEKALQMICRGECGSFDPKLLERFLDIANHLYDQIYKS